MVPPLLQYVCPHLSELRGEQYVAQLHKVLAIRSTKKLNLIGHSHGAHAVRYAAGVMPKQIASVLTVGGVNQGTVVASDVMKIANSTGTAELLNVLINTFGNVLLWAQGLDGQTFPYSALAAGHSTSMEGTAEFNQRFNTGPFLKKCGEGKYQEHYIQSPVISLQPML
ncbi:triacylglycerol lipase [Acinetobacter schindleri]|uniref:esterase/lipase family protein n=2 Tax=Moraxellaceae TaxID=468 RepID=UPI0030ABBA54